MFITSQIDMKTAYVDTMDTTRSLGSFERTAFIIESCDWGIWDNDDTIGSLRDSMGPDITSLGYVIELRVANELGTSPM